HRRIGRSERFQRVGRGHGKHRHAGALGRLDPDCVVIEDALVGIEAAKRAGMPVLAVATTNPLEALGSADAAVPGMGQVTLERLAALTRPQKS
ncbi:MAG: hypothetical protein ACKO39_00500, partial [Chthoniobacterales bacterium]